MISLTGAYTTHQLICRMALTSYDQIPENLAEYCYVEFTMPATQVSHTTARSVSFQNHDSDTPPEKYVRNLSRHEYRYDPPTIINILRVKLSYLVRVSIVFLLEYRAGILILKLYEVRSRLIVLSFYTLHLIRNKNLQHTAIQI